MLNEILARAVGPSRIDVAYERRGDPADLPVLLVMGIAAQMVSWPSGFIGALLSTGTCRSSVSTIATPGDPPI